MNKKQQKGTSKISLIVITLIVFAVLGYVVLHRNAPSYIPTKPQTQTGVLQSDDNLVSTSNDLDNTDIDSLDSDLNQIDSDSANF